MSDLPSPPSADALQDWITKAEHLIQIIVANIRRGSWIKRLLLLDALLFFAFNPGVANQWLKLLFNLAALPDFYPRYFWLAVGLLFGTALVVAAFTPIQSPLDSADAAERKAIKGLRPFTAADAEIFAQLQRDRNLREWLESITNDSFRFGILLGESGCGKTSFLQAGLVPKLTNPTCSHRGIYIKFSDRDPITTIHAALTHQLSLPPTTLPPTNLLPLLQTALTSPTPLTSPPPHSPTPLLLLFDQFEQFFVHYKRKEDRQPFIQALQEWYYSGLPVKIVVCVRGDMCDRLVELQYALGYSLGPQEVFRLEKFTPTAAAKILRVIAATEQLEFDDRFVAELAEQELANREDGPISPVDLQILAWMIQRQNAEDLRAFNRLAFQKFGGVEGLMSRFLEKTLEARVIKPQREAAVKVLLALTDLERQVRAGAFTIAALQAKLNGDVPAAAVEEATTWLARSDVRLITPIEQHQTTGYELAHERIIPALMRLAGQELGIA
jgi:hypothetical protein